MKTRNGFTLIEILLVIAIVGILGGAMTPLVIQSIRTSRENVTLEEMQNLHLAIVGDPDKGTFGYVGDMGRLPTSLDELVVQGAQPTFAETTNSNDIKWGWNGPYLQVNSGSVEYKQDAWGNDYDYGVIGTGQIRSFGPDGVNDNGGGDDIVFPPHPVNIFGNVVVTVWYKRDPQDWLRNPPDKAATEGDPSFQNLDVTLYFASNGSESSQVDTSAPFYFTNVPQGFHSIKGVYTDLALSPGNINAIINFSSYAGTTTYVEFFLEGVLNVLP
ncbi:MAG: prepilin-type N-terminal cleavage/methylation domain-containing protein [Candidatus Brocadiales bacterium]|nr:prepilin-type N-terminal cleavage/methylation domain-containing protein [Candidatus Brocadiales bacterium]